MNQDEQIMKLKGEHDRLQDGIRLNPIGIREGLTFFIPEGDYPRFGFEHFCWRNPPCVHELNMFMKYSRGKKSFLDIGSFHGIMALVFDRLNPQSQILAIEPNPGAFSILVQTITMNTNNVYLSNMALSDHNGKVKMTEKYGHYVQDDTGITVDCVQGDFLAAKFPIPPDIIKVDVEGMERNVLEGLYGTLKYNHPTVFLEIHNSKLSTEEIKNILTLVKELNYRVIDTITESEIKDEEVINSKLEETRLICL